jgi:hypothetical protein
MMGDLGPLGPDARLGGFDLIVIHINAVPFCPLENDQYKGEESRGLIEVAVRKRVATFS